jgi:hypothetical protein
MDMVSHIVFEPESGEVVHVHLEPADLKSSREEVLHHAGPQERRRVDVLRIHGVPPAGAFRVEDGQIRELDEGGGAGGGLAGPGFSDAGLKRQYEPRR